MKTIWGLEEVLEKVMIFWLWKRGECIFHVRTK